jgi:CHAT domain-containing protein
MTKDFYQGLTNTQQILQIFSHSSIDNQNPANSKIYFTDDSVPINDLYNKKVTCPLIFLSCCETDIGLTSKNDGYFNFVRALTFAGAKSIASTFWKSDDKATAYISTYFYQYLAQGYNKAQALQKSQQQFITTFPQLSNPLYWGAFKITGDISPLPIQENTQFSNTVLILALLFLALFLGWFFFIKNNSGS